MTLLRMTIVLLVGSSSCPSLQVSESLEKKRSAQMLCAPSYKAEIAALDPVMLPARCGRFIQDGLVRDCWGFY